jgi:hypothetical protein
MSAAGRLLRELEVEYEEVVRRIEAEGARWVAGEDWRPRRVGAGPPRGVRPSAWPRIVTTHRLVRAKGSRVGV